MQRRHGLARPRAALDDQDPGQRGTDHPVLFGLDGGDHVAHPPGSATPDRRQQHGLADQAAPVRLAHLVEVEYLIVDADHGAAAGIEMAPAEQADWIIRRGRVKGARRPRAPVNKDRLIFIIVQPDTADIKGLAIGIIHSPEAKATLDAVQLGKPSGLFGGRDFALHTGREGAACRAAPVHFTQGRLAPLRAASSSPYSMET